MTEMNRRTVLKTLGLATASAVAGGAATAVGIKATEASPAPQTDKGVPLYAFQGVHQTGVITQAPEAVLIVALQVLVSTPADLVTLFKTLSARTQALMGGTLGAASLEDQNFPPRNTGDMGYDQLNDGHLSVMVGVGSDLFDQSGKDRFGLASRKPIALKPMPHDLAGDKLQPELLGGDIFLQISSDHPLINMHTFRDILRNTKGQLSPMWVQSGFQRFFQANPGEAKARGLLGFKDGTANLDTADANLMSQLIWTGSEEPAWAQGGAYVAVRIIKEQIERWDRLNLSQQEASIGRQKTNGASLDNTKETQLPNYAADEDGDKTPLDAHIRKANPRLGAESDKRRMLRRGYLYMNGLDKSGLLDAGFLFMGFCRNVEEQFEFVKRNYMTNRNFPKQNTGTQNLDEYISCIGGNYFYVLPGIQGTDRFLGDSLLLG